jgi:hypothetical protein
MPNEQNVEPNRVYKSYEEFCKTFYPSPAKENGDEHRGELDASFGRNLAKQIVGR